MKEPNVFEFIGLAVLITLGMAFALTVVLAVIAFFFGGPARYQIARAQFELTDCRAKLAAVEQGKAGAK